jgi:hypothetical protein
MALEPTQEAQHLQFKSYTCSLDVLEGRHTSRMAVGALSCHAAAVVGKIVGLSIDEEAIEKKS